MPSSFSRATSSTTRSSGAGRVVVVSMAGGMTRCWQGAEGPDGHEDSSGVLPPLLLGQLLEVLAVRLEPFDLFGRRLAQGAVAVLVGEALVEGPGLVQVAERLVALGRPHQGLLLKDGRVPGLVDDLLVGP